MDAVKPVESLKFTGNIECSWWTFRQQFMLYMQAVGLNGKPDSWKIALILTVAVYKQSKYTIFSGSWTLRTGNNMMKYEEEI